MKWFKKWFNPERKPVVKASVAVPVLPRITLEDWQKDGQGIADFRSLYSVEIFQRMLAVLYTIRPRGPIKERSAEYSLGYIAGYEAAVSSLWVLTQHPKQHEPIKATFEPEEDKE